MPVSHLGLTVSQLPAATSFYLATLAPLGYRYIGQSGESIGLGVDHADFFLTQEPRGQAVSPAHIAFTADSRLTVRNCYAAALSSGAHPSGAPSYRDRDCTLFNAAVEDLDGNVIEFVHWEQIDIEEDHAPAITAPEDSRVLTWQKNVARSGLHSDVESLSSRTSRARSRAETIEDLVSSTSRSVRSRSEAPTPGLARARTLPISSSSTDFPSKAMFGTLLGATAGAAIAWAMMKSEGDNARDEAAYSASTRSRSATRLSGDDARSPRNYNATPRSHRTFSVTESAYSRKYPPRSLAHSMGRTRRAIEPAPVYDDDEVQEAISRYTSSRRPPPPQRSKTIDAIEYAPISRAGRESRFTTRRSATMPTDEPVGYLEAPKSRSATSRHSVASRRSTRQPVVDEDDEPLEAQRNAVTSHYTTASRRSPRHSVQHEDQDLKRRDSGISMGSHRSHLSNRSRYSGLERYQGSSASTLKPSRRGSTHDNSAAEIPLPASKAPSRASRMHPPTTEPRPQSYVTATQVPVSASRDGAHYADASDDSDGLDDTKTVVPEDSISCVDFSKPRNSARSSHSHRSSKHSSSRRSEAAGSDRTVRPARKEGSRHSAATLPARSREEYYGGSGKKRSTLSYA